VNAGREDRITIDQACDLVFQITGWRPRQIKRDTTKPQGVASRAADLTMAKKLLGWMPRVSYDEGFKRTVDWYFTHKNLGVVRANLDRLLMER
jgi:nucleoside-diphosphate-sugar epimerase